MRPIARPEFQYGARYTSGKEKPSWVYFMPQEDFRRELKLAFFETKDLDKALDAMRSKVAAEVRKRV